MADKIKSIFFPKREKDFLLIRSFHSTSPLKDRLALGPSIPSFINKQMSKLRTHMFENTVVSQHLGSIQQKKNQYMK